MKTKFKKERAMWELFDLLIDLDIHADYVLAAIIEKMENKNTLAFLAECSKVH